MKDTVISVCILLAVAIACFSAMNVTVTFCKDFNGVIEECMVSSQNGEWEKARQFSNEALSMLDDRGAILAITRPHQDINEIKNAIFKIEAAIELQDTETCITEGHSLIGYLETIASADALTITNIL